MCSYIQALTQAPIYRKEGLFNPFNFVIDHSKTPLYKSHSGTTLLSKYKKGDKLLFILRNPKENIRRNTIGIAPSFDDFQHVFFDHDPIFELYLYNLYFFEHWKKESRLLIYYEDLVLNPVSEMEKVLKFFGEPITDLLNQNFLKEIGQQTLTFYHNRYALSGGSHSKGEDVAYHSKQIPPEILHSIDQFLEKTYPDLWKKYLKRYSTNRENSDCADS